MSAPRRRRRHEEHEEHENHERWLVTYADMLTLLMVLFIVMFAMSQVDNEKYQALKSGLADGFGATASITDGSDSILDKHDGAISPNMASQLAQAVNDAQQDVARALTGSSEEEQDLKAAQQVYSKL